LHALQDNAVLQELNLLVTAVQKGQWFQALGIWRCSTNALVHHFVYALVPTWQRKAATSALPVEYQANAGQLTISDAVKLFGYSSHADELLLFPAGCMYRPQVHRNREYVAEVSSRSGVNSFVHESSSKMYAKPHKGAIALYHVVSPPDAVFGAAQCRNWHPGQPCCCMHVGDVN
jgi:hypothetical protein